MRIILSIVMLLVISVFAIVFVQSVFTDNDGILLGLAFIMATAGFISGRWSKQREIV